MDDAVEMTMTIPSAPPASVVKRFRMTRSRILSSAPPMTMTVPSVEVWPLRLGGTLRGSLPNGAVSRRLRRYGSGGRAHGNLVGQRSSRGRDVDPPEEERREREQRDRRPERRSRPERGDDRAGRQDEQ